MIAIIFLCMMKIHLFAMFMWNFTTTSLSIAEILLFYKKTVENCRLQHRQLTHVHCEFFTFQLVPGAAAIRRRRQPLSFKPQSAVKLVASRLSNNAVPINFTDLKTLIPVPRPVLLRCRLTVLKLNWLLLHTETHRSVMDICCSLSLTRLRLKQYLSSNNLQMQKC